MFASKNGVIMSILDAIGMGIGFTLALLTLGTIREVLGNGTWFGMDITGGILNLLIMILPPGGFLAFGFVLSAINKFTSLKVEHKIVHHVQCLAGLQVKERS